ncbi:MAG: TSUP family transporter [Actinobacteria bacterium]|uniref:Unannotated protein n=1 Tax=freshwater metagenome TaxID=449393 RepID=A0A6J6PEA1_9ZZZZ|nr:TSUP family transporter [Actinomycetota bacterium]
MTELLIVVAGLAGGVLAGLFGVGGGVIFVPVLVIGLGLTQVHAEAASLLAILPTAVIGTWRQLKFGNTDIRAALVIGTVSIIGVQIGVVAALSLPETTLRRLFGLLLLLVAAQTIRRAHRTR